MLARSLLIASTVVLLLALSVAGAAASPPVDVEITVDSTIPPDGGPSYGPFTARGPAVEAGVICPSGDTFETFGKGTGFQSNSGFNFQVIKRFTCADGSGTFLVKMQVRVDHKGDNFSWNIVGGTGAYERLHGAGQGIAPATPTGVLGMLSGRVHID